MKPNVHRELDPGGKVRLDKWLWAARVYKTRALAHDEIAKGRVAVNGQTAKPSREVHIGDRIEWRQSESVRTVVVLGVSDRRLGATLAQALYEETPESVAAREQAAAQRRLQGEPAQAILQGRPTKRDRRQLAEWNRWSASAEPK